MVELYNEQWNYASLFDVCQWFIDTYPEDIFVGGTENVEKIVRIREECKSILAQRKK